MYKYYLWINKKKGIRVYLKFSELGFRYDKINIDCNNKNLFERVFPKTSELTKVTEEQYIRGLYFIIKKLKRKVNK
tara:strand:- start:943 stop:1170 length:228 start_codon:yes stop_codon:yes gene_type:complete